MPDKNEAINDRCMSKKLVKKQCQLSSLKPTGLIQYPDQVFFKDLFYMEDV